MMFGFEANGDLRGAEDAHALRGLRAGDKEEDRKDERCVMGRCGIACPFFISLSRHFHQDRNIYGLLYLFSLAPPRISLLLCVMFRIYLVIQQRSSKSFL